mgnify:CR=1 FL=1
MVGLDVVAVDHVDVPGRAVFQRDTADPDVLHSCLIDKPRADAARDRVAVLAAFDELPVVVQKALDAGTLVLNDLAGQLLPAAADSCPCRG